MRFPFTFAELVVCVAAVIELYIARDQIGPFIIANKFNPTFDFILLTLLLSAMIWWDDELELKQLKAKVKSE